MTEVKRILNNKNRKVKHKNSAPSWNSDLETERSHIRAARRYQNEKEIKKCNEYIMIFKS